MTARESDLRTEGTREREREIKRGSNERHVENE
jgi:hypothetical protein